MAPTRIARPVAPEDIRAGVYIAVLHVVVERLPLCWDDCSKRDPSAPIRSLLLPWDHAGPLKVKSVCLPFVLVKTAKGEFKTLDTRRYRVAVLSRQYARRAFERLGAGTTMEELC